MDTLSSLFSKNFKKDPALLQFHGINEDLYEGKKLISKRKRTKAKIAKTSQLVEGFATQLDDLTESEFKQTAHLNEQLQRNLSSYATTYRNVLDDYVTARREDTTCRERCSNLPAVGTPQCNNEDVTGCTTCESCYAQGPGWWCPDTGQCSTHGNPCTSSCGAVCTADNVESCTTCETCYAQGPGFWCSDTGTCSTYENPCRGGCGGGGLQTSRHIDQILHNDSSATETNTQKQACLAGCGLSKAYLEETNITGSFNNETVSECGQLAPPPTACGPCETLSWWERFWDSSEYQREVCNDAGPGCCRFSGSFWGDTCESTGLASYCINPPCSNSPEGQMRLTACENSQNTTQEELRSGMDGRDLTREYSNLKGEYLSSDQCNDQDVTGCSTCESCYSKGPGYWCADTQTCSTLGNPCRGGCSSQCSYGNVDGCTTCETCYAQGPGFWCSDTGRCSTYGNPCTGGCGGGGYQSTPESANILLEDSEEISGRLSNILGLRQDLNTNNEDTRQNLTNTLVDYKYLLKKLKNTEQGITTVGAMMDEGKLKKTSASFKYYIWLGLAICVLMIAIRQLKK